MGTGDRCPVSPLRTFSARQDGDVGTYLGASDAITTRETTAAGSTL